MLSFGPTLDHIIGWPPKSRILAFSSTRMQDKNEDIRLLRMTDCTGRSESSNMRIRRYLSVHVMRNEYPYDVEPKLLLAARYSIPSAPVQRKQAAGLSG
jgi:hypothetical protein